MDEKLKRECKGCKTVYRIKHVEKIFKKYEKFGSASMPKDDVTKLLKIIIPDYNPLLYGEELNELLANYVKASKYQVHNKVTKQFEVKYLEDSIDFPSVLAITVHFLKKIEKDPNVFSGTSVVHTRHFPATDPKIKNEQKKKMF